MAPSANHVQQVGSRFSAASIISPAYNIIKGFFIGATCATLSALHGPLCGKRVAHTRISNRRNGANDELEVGVGEKVVKKWYAVAAAALGVPCALCRSLARIAYIFPYVFSQPTLPLPVRP